MTDSPQIFFKEITIEEKRRRMREGAERFECDIMDILAQPLSENEREVVQRYATEKKKGYMSYKKVQDEYEALDLRKRKLELILATDNKDGNPWGAPLTAEERLMYEAKVEMSEQKLKKKDSEMKERGKQGPILLSARADLFKSEAATRFLADKPLFKEATTLPYEEPLVIVGEKCDMADWWDACVAVAEKIAEARAEKEKNK